jgi:type I restriction enzyme R subunit
VLVKLLDTDQIVKNTFRVVNQFVVKNQNTEKRYDVVVFVNGLPLVLIELKNALDSDATLHKAYTQIKNYQQATPSLFYYNALCIISDGIDARVSSLSAPESRFLARRSPVQEEN